MGNREREHMSIDLTGPWMDADGGGEGEAGATLENALDSTPAAGDESGSHDPGGEAPASATETSPGEAETTTEQELTIPLVRHDSVLAKSRSETDEIRRATGWAADLDRQQTLDDAADRRWREADPAGYARHLQGTLSGGEEPQPDLRSADGQLLYSPEQAAKLARHHAKAGISAAEARFEGRLKPLEVAGEQQRSMAAANDSLTQASNWPLFNENMQAIADVVQEVKDQNGDIGLEMAYMRVVIPKLMASRDVIAKEERTKILAEMKRGTDDTDPTRSATSPTRKPDSEKSLTEALIEGMAGVTQ